MAVGARGVGGHAESARMVSPTAKPSNITTTMKCRRRIMQRTMYAPDRSQPATKTIKQAGAIALGGGQMEGVE